MRLPLTVWGLALGQALLITGNILLVSISSLIGQQLTAEPLLVTLPVALQFLGLMSATLPAALFMRRMGRKKGFFVGNLTGIAGGLLATLALVQQNFALFCISTFLLGVAIGISQQYRFAAVEACPPRQGAKAISLVMAGGVLAAILGPNLATWSRDLLPQHAFAGAFLVLTSLYLFTLLLILSLPLPKPSGTEQQQGGRGYLDLLKQPRLIAAITAGSIGYGVMVLVMTATPIAMHMHHYEFGSIASIIQWHVLGMFLPSFVTGHLISRFGVMPVIQTGCLLLIACVLTTQFGQSYWHYWVALIALGIGWNFSFIGATALLTRTYEPNEKARAQGMNDFFVFGFSALGSLLAGHLQLRLGWEMLNLLMLPPVVLAMLLLFWSNRRATS